MIPANKGQKLPPEPLTPDEVKRLIGACSKRAVTGVRNRALIVTLYRAGLRISEALALMPKDLDAEPAQSVCCTGRAIKPVWWGWTPERGLSCNCG